LDRWQASRLNDLPPYLFAEIDRRKREAIEAGRDLIDFGVGDPDRPTHSFIVERMQDAVANPDHHRYALGAGMLEFRRTAAQFVARRFGVEVDPRTEVLALLGSKEGIGHLPTAVVDPGDVVLVPDPGYPVYVSGTVFAGGKCHIMALSEERGWLPSLEEIPPEVARAAKLMYLNYPNNPTGACAPHSFFERAVAFAREYGILIAHDAAYSEMFFGGPPPSILQVPGARDLSIEFHSLSKTFNMTGWRIGFAVGNRDALAALARVKSNLDSGAFEAVQVAGTAALGDADHPDVRGQIEIYRRRRDLLVAGLREAGFAVKPPEATFYVWAGCPVGTESMSVARRLLDDADVVVIPGVGFGRRGEGYVRFALSVEEERTKVAAERIRRLSW